MALAKEVRHQHAPQRLTRCRRLPLPLPPSLPPSRPRRRVASLPRRLVAVSRHGINCHPVRGLGRLPRLCGGPLVLPVGMCILLCERSTAAVWEISTSARRCRVTPCVPPDPRVRCVHRDLGKPSVPMLSAAMSGSSLRPENTFCILAAQSDPSAPKPSEFRVQGLYAPTHGKPTKIAL